MAGGPGVIIMIAEEGVATAARPAKGSKSDGGDGAR